MAFEKKEKKYFIDERKNFAAIKQDNGYYEVSVVLNDSGKLNRLIKQAEEWLVFLNEIKKSENEK